MQLRNMVGQQECVNQNIYNIQDVNGEKDTNDNTTITVPAVAAMMATAGITGRSTYATTTVFTIAAKVMAAINQLLVNQPAMMQHMAAMNISPPQSIVAPAFNVPPIQNVSIPTHNGYARGGFNQGRSNAQGGRQRRGGGRGGHVGHGGRGRNPFANHMANLGRGTTQHPPQLGGFHGATIPNAGFASQEPLFPHPCSHRSSRGM